MLVIVFVVAIYGGARSVLLTAAADRISTVADQMERELTTVSANPFGAVSARTVLADQAFLDGFAGTGLFIEAFNQYGRPIGKSTNLGTNDLPTKPDQPWKARTAFEDGSWGFASAPMGRVLVNVQNVPKGKTVEATVNIAESLSGMDAILKDFRNFLVLGLIAAFGFITLASVSLARAALGPIGEITRAAQEIGSDDLTKRLNLKKRSDELGALAKTFDEMLARLEAAFARERRFIADASHELKTPLTVINANAQMLARWGARDPKITGEALSTIEAESATMARVINAMLTLAKTDNPEALTFETVDLTQLVSEVGTALQLNARSKGLSLELAVDPELETCVHGEPGLLRQLVTNLTENAIKFTESGSVRLGLNRHDGRVDLVVRDSGRGIAVEALPHIFERFYRADPARSRQVEGTGLGLAVVNNIVRVHGGTVRVDSEPGKGTTFTVDLPLETPSPSSPPAN
ncbi:MAG TPA: HAMP domain-containing sensor histidine kinase [Candidatus Eremiobacteraceae bacterium]|nr:HAMP domain-containing sensor histidine kinase [Candidatus Eremiobacteraceae bacterium]